MADQEEEKKDETVTVPLSGRATTMSSGRARPARLRGAILHSLEWDYTKPVVEVALKGLEAGAEAGSLTPDVEVALTGVAAKAEPGSLTPAIEVGLTGDAAKAEVGSLQPITITADFLANVETGAEVASAVGTVNAAVSENARAQDTYDAEVIHGIWGPQGGLIPGALDRAEADIVALLALRRADQSANAGAGIGHNHAPGPIGDVEAETLETALVAIRAYRKQIDRPEPDLDVLGLVLPALRAAMAVIGRFAKWMADGGLHYLKIVLDNAAAEFGKSIGKPQGIAGWLALYTALANGTSKDWDLLIKALEKLTGQ